MRTRLIPVGANKPFVSPLINWLTASHASQHVAFVMRMKSKLPMTHLHNLHILTLFIPALSPSGLFFFLKGTVPLDHVGALDLTTS